MIVYHGSIQDEKILVDLLIQREPELFTEDNA